jgi:hypothetical protein
VSGFELLLFSVDPAFVREAVKGGVSAIVVDWERVGKERRQRAADTEINQHTLEDLSRVRAATDARVVCRINGVHAETAAEIERALGAGADEILVPMVREPEQVREVLSYAAGRAKVSILVETDAAVRRIAELVPLPLARIYVGLNDLAIDRGYTPIFRALVDGTVEQVSRRVSCPFGFGGLTSPERGSPIPCRLLLGEMARLGCSFSLLRRSFHRDTRGRAVGREVERILEAVARSRSRSPAEIEHDREALVASIRALTRGPEVEGSRPS